MAGVVVVGYDWVGVFLSDMGAFPSKMHESTRCAYAAAEAGSLAGKVYTHLA
jgi:hypothetical protein